MRGEEAAGELPPAIESASAAPTAALRPFVAGYIGYRDASGVAGRHRGLPAPYLTMIVTLDDPLIIAAHPDPRTPPRRYDTLIGGLHTSPALISHDGRQSGIQVALSPLGARALLGIPAGEIAGADLDAAAVLGPFAAQVRERVLAAPDWAGRFAALDQLLLRRLRPTVAPPPQVVRAWGRLLTGGGALPVSVLADEVGWSSRYLSRQFGVEIGLSPKVAARVARFDRARRRLSRLTIAGRRFTLAEIAAACGYYDQAHLDRDFREFAGCPPSRWLAEEFRNFQVNAGAAAADSAA